MSNIEKLKKLGYMVTIPANANKIVVLGQNGKYFKAKQIKANGITYTLNMLGFLCWNLKAPDGYYDFFVKI